MKKLREGGRPPALLFLEAVKARFTVDTGDRI